jgi:uncharacterized protein (TIGR03435 family)
MELSREPRSISTELLLRESAMKKSLLVLLGVVAIAASPVFTQSSSSPKFEATSVQVSARTAPGVRGGVLRGNRYELRNATMLDLIRTAYDVPAPRVTGGPSWLEWNRFDVAGLAPAGTQPAVLKDMLKALLVERFALKAREDSTTTPGFALKVGPGTPKLKASTAAANCQGQGRPEPSGIPAQHLTCTGTTMAGLAEQLPRVAGAYFPGAQPVVDETGLAGAFDFELVWMAKALLAQAGADAIPLEKGLADLGLRLEPKEMKTTGIVVEAVSAEFTPNPPDLAKRMPAPPPPEFEVAEVKLSPPDAQGPRAQILPSGQINASKVPLNVMIGLAWDFPNEQYVAGPKWLESTNYELIARAFTGPNNANIEVDEDILRKMLQALIVDRFKMKYHMEDRPMTAYILTADKPKMAAADPSKRTRCVQGAAPANANRALAQQPRQFTCTNVTMKQFGELIPQFAAGYTQVAVLDKTGLEGGYDFTLSFSGVGQVQNRTNTGAAPGAAASDPNGALSLWDAINNQLGLKVEEQKRPQPVLVIDSIAEKPTDN